MPQDICDSFVGFLASLKWSLHHKLAQIKPKFAELIAFRNIILPLGYTTVDEDAIAAEIKALGYKLKYIPEALYHWTTFLCQALR